MKKLTNALENKNKCPHKTRGVDIAATFPDISFPGNILTTKTRTPSLEKSGKHIPCSL